MSTYVLYTISNLIIADAFPASKQSLAGGIFNTATQIGNSVGLAIGAVIASAVTGDGSSIGALEKGYRATFWASDLVLNLRSSHRVEELAMDTLRDSPVQACHFLRLPLGLHSYSNRDFLSLTIEIEIRQEIYRHILRPWLPCCLDPNEWTYRHLPQSCDENGEEEDNDDEEEGSNAMSDDGDSYIHDPQDDNGTEHGDDENESWSHRDVEILRVNRQISWEASNLFYSETTLFLLPSNILCLRPEPDLCRIPKNIWRHDPLHEISKRDERLQHIYTTPEMDGQMEPHIFARFRNVQLHAVFNFSCLMAYGTKAPPYVTLGINTEFDVIPSHRMELELILRKTKLFEDLTAILRNSEYLKSFLITLSVQTGVQIRDEVVDPDDFGEDYEIRKNKCIQTTWNKASEIFVESGVLEESDDETCLEQRHLSILRINRQIYSETSSLLYSELRLLVKPGDIFCLRPDGDLCRPSKKVWRHNPLYGIGHKSVNGDQIYNTPKMDGLLEPHVFTRFQNVEIQATLNLGGSWKKKPLRNRDKSVIFLVLGGNRPNSPAGRSHKSGHRRELPPKRNVALLPQRRQWQVCILRECQEQPSKDAASLAIFAPGCAAPPISGTARHPSLPRPLPPAAAHSP
ncbi:hypothetical protein G7Y89_g7981 [Cudoniella acicularis]|uniref:Uncharacterized protein n=1 Tax=Cudoniella acicularis TaxID=354080 RepID=A0A8H4W3A5_9HELO|nr:hypothetical protein G7Y89_g7981 [Cudoniella acicularis]